ncbi:MAG: GNAT family N-acetyltransferase [Acetobacteraceae bacterium]
MPLSAAINPGLPVLRTARLRLRCPEMQDGPGISAMMTPAVSATLGAWPVPFTLEMAAERVAQAQARAAAGEAFPWVVERQADAALLGWVEVVRHPTLLARATVGYWLGEAHQGHGYMREAIGPVIADALVRLDLDAIEATAHADNIRSLAVLRGAGMRMVGPVTIYAAARNQEEPCLLFERVGPACAGRVPI